LDLLDTHIHGIIGDEGFRRLVAAFYRRVATDDLLRPMYPKDDLAGAEERLRGFLIMRFGGPQDYAVRRGHPRLRMRHAGFHINRQARDRWISLMEQALEETNLPEEPARLLRQFFHDAASFLINRPA
jgi:hemoglobin